MERSVRLTCRYHDDHLVELIASAWNGRFGGATRLWVAQGALTDAAALLAGFPESLEDKRDVAFGVFGPECGGGGIVLNFSCVDRAGHCEVRLKLESDSVQREPPLERVELIAAVEPAAVDDFVVQMRTLNSSLTGSAVLQLA
jgi:hypothetical protein